MCHGIGEEGGVRGSEIVVAVVAHERFDARLFGCESSAAEGVTTAQESLRAGATEQ